MTTASTTHPTNTHAAKPAEQGKEQPPYPPLRDDVDLIVGAVQKNGSPSWILHDTVTNRFVQIGWQECEILKRWPLGSSERIAEAVNQETTLEVSSSDVEKIYYFLHSQQLLRPAGMGEMVQRLKRLKDMRGGAFKFLLNRYLFFRVPLLRPNQFLANTAWMVRPFFTRTFAFILVIALLSGLFLVQRQWDVFINTTQQFFSLDALLYYGIAIWFGKCFHELGHAYRCKLYGLNVPVMGVAFLVCVPFLYTDTSESWRLRSRKKRFLIGASGMLTEISIAIFATLAWTVMPPGIPRSCIFILATTSWVLTLAVNLNPFMRWDGYYMFSDLIGLNNLHTRSDELGKWWLRELIFNFGDPPPERNSRMENGFMICYAYMVWIYRLLVFAGIALLVYHFFIKIIGILLAAIELVVFIWRPIKSELKVWYDRRKEMTWNKHSVISLGVLIALLLLFIIPWKNHVLMPAVIRPGIYTKLFPVVSGQLEHVLVTENSFVTKGTELFVLRSPELQQEMDLALKEIELADISLKRSSSDLMREQREVAIESSIKARQNYLGLQKNAQQLRIKAPFAGTVVRLAEGLRPGLWVSETFSLGTLATKDIPVVYAYADSNTAPLVNNGIKGIFYPENGDEKAIPVVVEKVGAVRSNTLAEPTMATTYGGQIAVEPESDRPIQSLFLLQFRVTGENNFQNKVQRGTVRLAIRPDSYAVQMWKNLHSLMIREFSF